MLAAAAPGSDAATLLLELGVVFLGLAVLGRVASRVGLSPIPFYLLAGLAFGRGGVADLGTSEPFIALGSQIGVVLLLLMLGLEYSADELVGNLRQAAPAGAADLVLNLLPGVAAGLLLGWRPLTAVFLGGITYISSSGVVAKLLDDFGRTGNRETPTVLSILVIEDLAMAVYLPTVAGLLVGGGLLATGASVGVALLAVAVALVVALRFGPVLSRAVHSRSGEVLLLTILGITMLVAGLAEELQVSAAVGAFLVGIALSGEVAESAHGLLAPLRDLFAGVFFLFFGLELDPGSIPAVLGVAVALAVVTTATKIATGWWAALRAGVGRRGRARAGFTLVARGEFSIVIAGLAVAADLDADIGPVAAAYVLLLAVGGPVLSRYADAIMGAIDRRTRTA